MDEDISPRAFAVLVEAQVRRTGVMVGHDLLRLPAVAWRGMQPAETCVRLLHRATLHCA